MRAAWIAMIAIMGWSTLAEARSPRSGKPAHNLRMADRWKSPVASKSIEADGQKRWRLAEIAILDGGDEAGIRWKLRGAGVKLRMPLSLN